MGLGVQIKQKNIFAIQLELLVESRIHYASAFFTTGMDIKGSVVYLEDVWMVIAVTREE